MIGESVGGCDELMGVFGATGGMRWRAGKCGKVVKREGG